MSKGTGGLPRKDAAKVERQQRAWLKAAMRQQKRWGSRPEEPPPPPHPEATS